MAALEIARAGGTVLLVARTTARLEDTAREIERSHGLAEVYRADLSAERSIDELLERVDLLVHSQQHRRHDLPALVVDRLRLRALHAHTFDAAGLCPPTH